MSDNEVDILYEEIVALKPGSIGFVRQQIDLLENLQNNFNTIPVDYNDFLCCVKHLKTNYQEAVVLSAWKQLLSHQLLSLGKILTNTKKTNELLLKNQNYNHHKEFHSIKLNNEKIKPDLQIVFDQNNVLIPKKSTDLVININNELDLSQNIMETERIEDSLSYVKPTITKCIKKRNMVINKDNIINLNTDEALKQSRKTHNHNVLINSWLETPRNDEKEIKTRKVTITNKNKKSFLRNDKKETKASKATTVNKNKKSCNKYKKTKINLNLSDFSIKDKKSTRKNNLFSTLLSKNFAKTLEMSKINELELLNSCGISKLELIEFFKAQRKEKVAEEEKLKQNVLQIFHDRLVDVILPKHVKM
uniref:Uncharacterized protein n=1 Tax=Clastoptera arizonana TaxID=38151 RepID=A0A1B6DY85_9HEMI